MAIVAEAERRSPERSGTPAYRLDIDGLRTLAIFLVVIYHVWLGRVSGGVDVFLMISAFFLTGSLARRVIRGDPIALGTYWARRFQRLLPAASVTLVGVLAAGFVFFPALSWPRLWGDTWASLFYVQNWRLAFSEIDYYARDTASTSPLQHFWSLSVQGQVFVLWPILIALIALLLRKNRALIRPVLIAVFSAILVASLVFSIVETRDVQAFAYFDTRTRLWEFAAGSLLALVLPYVQLPRLLAAVLGWAGIVGIVLCGIVLDVREGFPGYLALWPVLCTAAVIVSGNTITRFGPARMLSTRPFQYFSKDAYALYLVHWPILITVMVMRDSTVIGPYAGAAIIVVSVILARLIHRFVEGPLSRAPKLNGSNRVRVLVIAVCVVLVAAPLVGWQSYQAWRTSEIAANAEKWNPGAAAVAGEAEVPKDVPILPVATELDAEWQSIGEACSGRFAPSAPELAGSCAQNDLAASASTLVVVIGDSHAQQLGVPLETVAKERGFGLISMLKGGCTIGQDEEDRSTEGDACQGWLAAAMDYVVTLNPTAVYTVITRADPTAPERLLDGLEPSLERFEEAGITVLGVRDNPRFDFNMYQCVTKDAPETCAVPRSQALASTSPAASLGDRIVPIDYTPWLCPQERCEGEIGNVAIYMDDNHVSRAYGRTLSPMLGEMIDASAALPAG